MKARFDRGWQREMFWLCILWRIVEKKDVIPVDTQGTEYAFLEDALFRMSGEGLLELGGKSSNRWKATPKGVKTLGKLVAVFDHSLKFEIFASVDIDLSLDDELSEDGVQVFDHCHDPRFDPEVESDTVCDLRLAMMSYLSARLSEEEKFEGSFDPHRIVFVQKLADGEFDTQDFWTDLAMGTLHEQVEEIVSCAYVPSDIGGSPEEVDTLMEAIYTAGMLEQRKRDGNQCSDCGTPLAVFELDAEGPLEACPVCDASFSPPPREYEYECPNCGHGLFGDERSCPGCGARVDFALPSGTVSETQEEIAETVYEEEEHGPWDQGYGYYGYTPYGHYDPYNPFVDALAFGVVCAVIF